MGDRLALVSAGRGWYPEHQQIARVQWVIGMRLRLTKVDESQFLTCLKHQVWGSKNARFKEWKPGDYLAIIVDKATAALAQVSGPPYVSQEPVWDNGVFPHRIPLQFVHAMHPPNRPPILGKIRDALMSAWGVSAQH